MSHNFNISEEQYAQLAAYAEEYKQTPETLFQKWVSETIHKVEALQQSRRKEQTSQEEEELRNHPLLQIAGILDIGGPGWADKHDEYFAETYLDNYAETE